jgi:hypothetical protein
MGLAGRHDPAWETIRGMTTPWKDFVLTEGFDLNRLGDLRLTG